MEGGQHSVEGSECLQKGNTGVKLVSLQLGVSLQEFHNSRCPVGESITMDYVFSTLWRRTHWALTDPYSN